MHVDEALLAPVRARYGEPAVVPWVGELSEQEFRLAGSIPRRRHDVTIYVFHGERLALIPKPPYTARLWRPAARGVNARQACGARRAAGSTSARTSSQASRGRRARSSGSRSSSAATSCAPTQSSGS